MRAGHGAASGCPCRRAADDGHDEPDPDHGHQVDGPVLRVEECRPHDGDRNEVPGAGFIDRPAQRKEPAAGQEDDQRIHARLRGVVHGERCAGEQHEGRPGHRPASQAPAAEPGDRQRDHRDHARQGAHGVVGLPEEDDPEVEEVVVQRRRTVVLQRVGDLVQRQAGDVDGQGLVQPQARPGPEAKEQGGGDHHPHADADDEARATSETGYLLRHGPHGRTRGLRSRIIRRRGRPAQGEGNRHSEGGKGAP